MNLNITTTLRIASDFTVQHLHTMKDGKRKGTQEWRDLSFHGDLASALASVLHNKRVEGGDKARVERVLAKLHDACKAVSMACDGFISAREAAGIEGRVFGDFPDNFWS